MDNEALFKKLKEVKGTAPVERGDYSLKGLRLIALNALAKTNNRKKEEEQWKHWQTAE